VRPAILVAWAVLLGGPLLTPVVLLAANPGGWGVWREADRLAELAANTAALCTGTVLVAVPVGWFLGLWAGRFGGTAARLGLLFAAFVPLPVYALAWQTVLGGWLPAVRLSPGDVAWRPWAVGLLPAIWVHATAAVPWVAWAVAAAVRRTDAELEDEALQTGGVPSLIRRVLYPRSLTAAVLAGAWVAAQPLTEITVSDMMMVRSAAEEVYTEMVVDRGGLAGAVATAVPVWLASAAAGLILGRRFARFDFTSPGTTPVRSLPLPQSAAWSLRVVVTGLMTLFAVVPLLALVWKAAGGGTGRAPEWSFLFGELGKVWSSERGLIARSAAAAAAVGLLTAFLAWVSCWAARRSAGFRAALFSLCVLLLLAPGPVIGLGLKQFIAVLMDVEDFVWPRGPVWSLLYYQPTPLPAGWAALLRFFPVACVVVWPAVRAIPDELLDAARLDGWGFARTWNRLVAPLTTPAFLTAAVAVAALALGEVSAGKLVNPPGHRVYILWLFDQMHYGSESMLAAMALTQVALTAGAVTILASLTSGSARTAR
jgi:iron(III) transport system permease protein